MAIIRYKRLAEIFIIHEYYMLASNGQSVFDLDSAEEQRLLVEDFILEGKYDIKKDLGFEPVGATEKLMKDHKIKLVSTSSGFFLGIEVNAHTDVGNNEVYTPFIGDIEGLNLKFSIKINNPLFNSFTRQPYKQELPAIYYFNNQPKDGPSIFPALSRPIPPVQNIKTYQMGMLVEQNGQIMEALGEATVADTSLWKPITGSGYVNEADRILLPHRFSYLPPSLPGGVQHFEASLSTPDGTEVKKIIPTNGPFSGAILLDFRLINPISADAISIEAGSYQLKLIANGKEIFNGLVYLDSALYDRQSVGIIDLTIGKNQGDFSLLEPDGSLKTKRLSDGNKQPHPRFELRFKSRLSYWRYVSNKYKTLKVGTKADPYLAQMGKDLVSKKARNLSAHPTVFQTIDENTRDPVDTILLPNPAPSSLKEQEGKVYSDIYVSSIKDLIEE